MPYFPLRPDWVILDEPFQTGWPMRPVYWEPAIEPRSLEQREADRLAMEGRVREVRECAEALRLANERAEALLLTYLSEQQRTSYERGYIDVTASLGGRYRIHTQEGVTGNVYRLDSDGQFDGQYCCHPSRVLASGDVLPPADAFLGQYLALRADEQGFLAKANLYKPCRCTACRRHNRTGHDFDGPFGW